MSRGGRKKRRYLWAAHIPGEKLIVSTAPLPHSLRFRRPCTCPNLNYDFHTIHPPERSGFELETVCLDCGQTAPPFVVSDVLLVKNV